MNCVVEERINNIQSENALIQGTWLSGLLKVFFKSFTNIYCQKHASFLNAHSIDLSPHLLALSFNKCELNLLKFK